MTHSACSCQWSSYTMEKICFKYSRSYLLYIGWSFTCQSKPTNIIFPSTTSVKFHLLHAYAPGEVYNTVSESSKLSLSNSTVANRENRENIFTIRDYQCAESATRFVIVLKNAKSEIKKVPDFPKNLRFQHHPKRNR